VKCHLLLLLKDITINSGDEDFAGIITIKLYIEVLLIIIF